MILGNRYPGVPPYGLHPRLPSLRPCRDSGSLAKMAGAPEAIAEEKEARIAETPSFAILHYTTMSDQLPTNRRKFLRYGIGGMAIASTSHVVLARDGRA